MLMRQGDVFIEAVSAMPEASLEWAVPHGTLVHGEVTGHSHRLEDLTAARLFAGSQRGEMFIEVFGDSTRVIHEEHGAISLERGIYRVWRQREYSPEKIRPVSD